MAAALPWFKEAISYRLIFIDLSKTNANVAFSKIFSTSLSLSLVKRNLNALHAGESHMQAYLTFFSFSFAQYKVKLAQ